MNIIILKLFLIQCEENNQPMTFDGLKEFAKNYNLITGKKINIKWGH